MPASARGRAAGKSDKPWRDAIRRAVSRRAEGDGDPQQLDKLADQLVKEALKGDIPAMKEIGDRLDGKAAQMIQGDPTQPLVHEFDFTKLEKKDRDALRGIVQRISTAGDPPKPR